MTSRKVRKAPHIFETGLWVNTDIYLEVMESTALPWIKTVAGDRPWVWQQNPVPCHVSNRSIKWLKDHCYDLVSKDCWPPSSPDLNPLAKTCVAFRGRVEALIEAEGGFF
jgi:hypothetical protein